MYKVAKLRIIHSQRNSLSLLRYIVNVKLNVANQYACVIYFYFELIKLNKPLLSIALLHWRYPNMKSIKELIYKRGYGKVDKQRIALTDNSIIEEVKQINICACNFEFSHCSQYA